MYDSPIMIITGTSKGVGRGMASFFLSKGYTVFGCSRGAATIESERYHHTQVDVGDEKQVRSWVRLIKTLCTRIDVLVCNAGVVESVLYMTATPASVVESYLHTNIAGTYYVCREVAKAMMLQKSGRIVTISSIMTRLHEPGTSVYAPTKSAVEEMTKVLAAELAPTGITCNVVALAMVSTGASSSFGEEWKNRMLERQTLKRPVTIEEICHVVSFYTSPESGGVTGQVLYMGLVT
jgi:3-oxoacyl-[acyl-carrier protein] reductase